MTSSNSELSEKPQESESLKNVKSETAPSHSATTREVPTFGWSGYAERINGRFAMIGFLAILLVEAISRTSFLQWSGLL